MKLKDKLGNWNLYAIWEKEKEVGVWDFKGEEGNSHGDRKTNVW